MACIFCKETIYVKTIRYTARMLAPLTREEELRQQVEDITGEVYLRLSNNYCPMCGEKVKKGGTDNG